MLRIETRGQVNPEYVPFARVGACSRRVAATTLRALLDDCDAQAVAAMAERLL